jgi:DNA-binding CsgD family transcriptional regulator
MAQGRVEIAAGAIRRLVGATEEPLRRARLLPAYVEIMLESGDIGNAGAACQDLERIAERFDTGLLGAIAAQARGAVALAEGDAETASGSLRRALQVWQQIEAPYMAARTRLLLGLACRALGDEEGAGLELDAARAVFLRLGAASDLARLEGLASKVRPARSHGLSPRELQVLRLIATGKTNKLIAGELFVSERTIDRHVSNILTKLALPSRSAATAYAYRHGLI